jgi:hypothetical protein
LQHANILVPRIVVTSTFLVGVLHIFLVTKTFLAWSGVANAVEVIESAMRIPSQLPATVGGAAGSTEQRAEEGRGSVTGSAMRATRQLPAIVGGADNEYPPSSANLLGINFPDQGSSPSPPRVAGSSAPRPRVRVLLEGGEPEEIPMEDFSGGSGTPSNTEGDF